MRGGDCAAAVTDDGLMSGFSPLAGQRGRAGLPVPPQGDPIAAYRDYASAQRAVDHLSDEHFAVENITVVGEGVQLVERVTGRLTYPRAAGAGAASGAWFGLFIGLLLSLFGGGSGGSSWPPSCSVSRSGCCSGSSGTR